MNARTAPRPGLAAGLALGLAAALLSGCAAGREQPAAASSGPAATPTAAPSAATPAASTTPAVRTVAVAYSGGEVTGTSGREQVRVGEQVVLRISSDVAEEVHVHGYDLEGVVPAGGSVDIPLSATVPGVFEVELHDSGEVLFQLRVA